ncbi:MAG: histidine triad nucleotide-binding protein [Ignavibacteriaceae bacterium]|nr:histidine triad nucleotide-binding protein [Ignavibacteriaceae bacterium]
MAETIFSKIIRKEIPADIVFESDTVLAFRDISPQAPIHIIIIPKQPIAYTTEIDGKKDASLLGDLFDAANLIAKEQGIDKTGFRIVINNGINAGQEVPHLHLHLLGGRKLSWPPG